MRRLVGEARVGHLGTVTSEGRPHVVPCCFTLDGETIYSAVDAKPKTTAALRRLDNIRANPAVALVVDYYDDHDWSQLWWVRVDGLAKVIESGAAREAALDALADKYPQYRETRPPGAVITIHDLRWRGWES
jgi:PPOX class probable F420-dependent enzyme